MITYFIVLRFILQMRIVQKSVPAFIHSDDIP
jgi:hypothetical protein